MMAMEMLERYLWAIGRYLPDDTKADTMAELRANLLEQMDERAEELGRTLTETDVAAVLKAHGKPEAVALRYLPQRSLIGPAMYPFYLLALRRSLPIWLLMYGLAILATVRGGSLAELLSRFAWGMVPSTLAFLAAVTIVFVVIDWANDRGKLGAAFHDWDPMKMPEIPKEAQPYKAKSFATRVLELLMHVVWMGWVLAIPWKPVWHVGAGVIGIDMEAFGVDFAPVWHVFYVLLVVMLSVQLVMKTLALRDGNHAWMKPMEIFTDLLGVVALGTVAFAKEYFVPLSPTVDVHSLAAANQAVGQAMRIALLFAVFGLGLKWWKYFKQRPAAALLAF
jgi:hypothetical protein